MMFNEKIAFALTQKTPFVAYRKPNKTSLCFMKQLDNKLYYLTNFLESGFVFAPFDDHSKSILFPINSCEVTNFDNVNLGNLKNKFNYNITKSAKENHIKLVSKAVDFIKNTNIKKIVLSRKEVFKHANFNAIETFFSLLKNYKSAFVYIWYHPKIGLWLGATPETLLQVKNNNFKTMALAGTQIYNKTLNVNWQNKEIIEQRLVANYITWQLKNNNIHYKVSKTYTIKAGNLLHLCTNVLGRINAKDQLRLMIKALHPTPAVCGLPTNEAKQFILANENYNREYYTGFLGELNLEITRKNNRKNIENHAYQISQKQTNLFVNLRCIKVQNNKINLYVGGGITKDSDAKSEFLETVEKSKTIKKCL